MRHGLTGKMLAFSNDTDPLGSSLTIFNTVPDKHQPERNDGLRIYIARPDNVDDNTIVLTNEQATELKRWLDHHGY